MEEQSKYYYGLIDTTYGFLLEDDPRITEDMIELTEEQHQQLLDGQSEGLVIVEDNNQVILAEPDRYYIDENYNWVKRTDEEYEAIVEQKSKALLIERLKEQLNEIDNKKIRSTSAIALGIATQDDIDYLTRLEEQAEDIREQIRRLQ